MLSYKSLLTQLPFQIPQLPFFQNWEPAQGRRNAPSKSYFWCNLAEDQDPPPLTHTHTLVFYNQAMKEYVVLILDDEGGSWHPKHRFKFEVLSQD